MNFQLKLIEETPEILAVLNYSSLLSLFLLIFNIPLILFHVKKQVKELNWSNLGSFIYDLSQFKSLN